ncbi:MAG: nicotinate-nicotinamide nucleotide adenylyltransferase [Actinobacteria bacterium]|nr:nicotinate-nicotinamide nucleotide adenylyltransferase [Actinomycetota bacterium]
MTGLFGGAFDPPHNGHLALARAAIDHFDLDRLVILVAAEPGHKLVYAPAEVRMQLAAAAFPGYDVELDPYSRTIDMLRARAWEDPVFLVGADQLAAFPSWKEPEAVLAQSRLGVGTRPGYMPAPPADDRIELFDVPAVDISSSEIRERVRAGEPIEDLVPAAVARLVEELGIYRQRAGLH